MWDLFFHAMVVDALEANTASGRQTTVNLAGKARGDLPCLGKH